MTHIIDSIYLGDIDDRIKPNVKFIINLSGKRYKETEGIEYIHFNLSDSDSPKNQKVFLNIVNDIVNYIDSKKDSGILIHCFMGYERSASVIVAYLMLKEKLTLWSAIDFVRDKRKGSLKRLVFLESLTKLEFKLK